MKVTHVLAPDDHVLVRAGIRTLARKNSDVKWFASRQRLEALEIVKTELPRSRPDGHRDG